MGRMKGVPKSAWREADMILTNVDNMFGELLSCLRDALGAKEVDAIVRLQQRGVGDLRDSLYHRMRRDKNFDLDGADADMKDLFLGHKSDPEEINVLIAEANARDGLAEAMATLGPDGFGLTGRPIDPNQVCHAKTFLSKLEKTISVNRRCRGSYGLKHDAERYAGTYISNGALIAAAVELGFRVSPIAKSPNAYLGYTTKSWKALVDDTARA